MTDLENLKAEALSLLAKAESPEMLDDLRVAFLGKKGKITEIMKTLGSMDAEQRKTFGAAVNKVKDEIQTLIAEKKEKLETEALNQRLKTEAIDVTLPPRPDTNQGRIHPVTQVTEELLAIFAQMGFELAEGPDVEDDWHCFEALNIPKSHPARQMQDTFYMKDGGGDILRTQTSAVQIRTMDNKKPPIRIVCPGRTYRCDYDMTHTPMFHQIEGLVIDKTTTMGHLKGCLIDVMKTFFEVDDVPVRFRPSYFPFTEPSAEMDIGCSRENGEFKIAKDKGWMEILGCGMVHPNVLKNCGIDPAEYQGFAFGFGIDRMAMLKYGIPDLRTFFEGDIRWMRHYGFIPLDEPSLTTGLSLNGGLKL